MIIYKLESKNTRYYVGCVYETKEFYVVPIINTYNYDIYDKSVFSLETEEVVVK